MNRLLLSCALALALAPAPAVAHGWRDESRLVSGDGTVICEGSRSWIAKKRRRFWTEGRMCPMTREQCLAGYVIDRDGSHKVTACSDDAEWSEGRKADYLP